MSIKKTVHKYFYEFFLVILRTTYEKSCDKFVILSYTNWTFYKSSTSKWFEIFRDFLKIWTLNIYIKKSFLCISNIYKTIQIYEKPCFNFLSFLTLQSIFYQLLYEKNWKCLWVAQTESKLF